MKLWISVLLSFFMFLATGVAQVTVYVSPSGSDSNPGSIDLPFKTPSKGLTAIGSNGTVFLRGGVYLLGSSKLSLGRTGTALNPIRLWAYPGETAIFDCTGNGSDGISISGSYYHLKGIEVQKAGHNGINISGNYNTVENCAVHDNGNTGLHLTVSGTGVGPSYNLILNCDAYRNYDPPIGGNADGFSAKWTYGPGNVFRGCRAYNNSDDGWDLWMGTSTVLIDSCYAFRNGVDVWFSGSFDGNGNGFKLGGNYVATPHIVRNCVAFDNAGNGGKGFDENNNTGGQTLYNCTSFRNKGNNYSFRNVVVDSQFHVFKNCVSHNGGVSISSGTQEKNSWQGFSVSDSDFRSVDTAGVAGPRKADGTLPAGNFLRLAPRSSLIDAGVNVGLPFKGHAPDLGAFEADFTLGLGDKSTIPATLYLDQNFPNPFNPATTITYRLNSSGWVALRIFDALGRNVATLVEGIQSAGEHRVPFSAGELPSGTYVARLQAGPNVATIKLSHLK
jgi:hypothetical protein